MKKTLLSILSVGFSICAAAQIANGSVAPDFTATDINGNTHSLSTYLAAGKTVILDVSATWCGPCWNYHNSNALADLYNSYGPGGSDEVVVLFVEGDAATTLADLNGTGNNTQGNWTEHSPFPIINSSTIAGQYQIAYFPTVFRICPNGIVTEIDPLPAAQLKTNINTNCGVLAGASNYPVTNATEFRSCSSTGMISARMRNMGSNNITSASAVLKENGEIVATKEFSGSVPQFFDAAITFPSITINEEAVYTAEITSVNAGTPFHPEQAVKEIPVGLAKNASSSIQVKIYTDNYPAEITWRIKNPSGVIIASGGPYPPMQANSVVTHNVNLSSAEACYSMELSDSYGDGWGYGSTPHGAEIYSNGSLILQKLEVPFANLYAIPAAFKVASLGVAEEATESFSIYPNPSTGIFNIRSEKQLSIVVSDMTGKTVYSGKNLGNGSAMNLSGLQSGMYFARVNDGVSESVEKLIIR